MLVTHISASTCCLTWIIIESIHKGKPTVIGAITGAITGLIVITPASGFVDQTGGFVMGLFGALSCYPFLLLKNRLELDEKPSVSDYPDAFGVHAIGGMVGAFWTGLFANPDIHDRRAAGGFYFNGDQLGWQIVGIFFAVVWSAIFTAIIMLTLKFTIGINQVEETEIAEIQTAPEEAPDHPLKEISVHKEPEGGTA